MTLDQYLSENGINDPAFAAQVGLHKSQVGRLRRGLSRPSWQTVKKIDDATGGKVKAADWFEQAESAA